MYWRIISLCAVRGVLDELHLVAREPALLFRYLTSYYPPVDLADNQCFAVLLACALYEEFWMNYISWLESLPEPDTTHKIRSAFRRACTSHLPNKVSVHSSSLSGPDPDAHYFLAVVTCPDPDLVATKFKETKIFFIFFLSFRSGSGCS